MVQSCNNSSIPSTSYSKKPTSRCVGYYPMIRPSFQLQTSIYPGTGYPEGPSNLKSHRPGLSGKPPHITQPTTGLFTPWGGSTSPPFFSRRHPGNRKYIGNNSFSQNQKIGWPNTHGIHKDHLLYLHHPITYETSREAKPLFRSYSVQDPSGLQDYFPSSIPTHKNRYPTASRPLFFPCSTVGLSNHSGVFMGRLDGLPLVEQWISSNRGDQSCFNETFTPIKHTNSAQFAGEFIRCYERAMESYNVIHAFLAMLASQQSQDHSLDRITDIQENKKDNLKQKLLINNLKIKTSEPVIKNDEDSTHGSDIWIDTTSTISNTCTTSFPDINNDMLKKDSIYFKQDMTNISTTHDNSDYSIKKNIGTHEVSSVILPTSLPVLCDSKNTTLAETQPTEPTIRDIIVKDVNSISHDNSQLVKMTRRSQSAIDVTKMNQQYPLDGWVMSRFPYWSFVTQALWQHLQKLKLTATSELLCFQKPWRRGRQPLCEIAGGELLPLTRPSRFDVLRAMWIDTATITIQRHWRGYRGREKALAEKRFTRWKAYACQNACIIQRHVREYLKKLREEEKTIQCFVQERRKKAACKIQHAWRIRKAYIARQEEILVETLMRVRACAAVQIQRVYRGFKARQLVDLESSHWIIHWHWDPPGKIVEVVGTFTNPPWTKRVLMSWVPASEHYSVVLPRIPGRHELKFVINGEYCCDGTLTVISDGAGHYNNVVKIYAADKIPPFQVIRERLREIHRQMVLSSSSRESKWDSSTFIDDPTSGHSKDHMSSSIFTNGISGSFSNNDSSDTLKKEKVKSLPPILLPTMQSGPIISEPTSETSSVNVTTSTKNNIGRGRKCQRKRVRNKTLNETANNRQMTHNQGAPDTTENVCQTEFQLESDYKISSSREIDNQNPQQLPKHDKKKILHKKSSGPIKKFSISGSATYFNASDSGVPTPPVNAMPELGIEERKTLTEWYKGLPHNCGDSK